MLIKYLNKENIFLTIIPIISLIILCITQASAQEEIVITTYYPSLTGLYDTVKAHRMTVGRSRDPNSGAAYLVDDGVLSLDPRPTPPTNPADGQIYYDINYHALFYYTSSGLWFPLFIQPRFVRYDPFPVVPLSGIDPGARVTWCDPAFMHVINVFTLGGSPVSPFVIANPGLLDTSGYMLCH
ncbi:MAG: hypothetical protein WDL87_06005 [Candidatus Omnitrophota bacterium]|jgi:hypothetical protein